MNLNIDGSCTKSCSDYTNTTHYGCAEGTLCAAAGEKERGIVVCNGRIVGCTDLSISSDFSVAYASDRISNMNRRYAYLIDDDDDDEEIYGQKSDLWIRTSLKVNKNVKIKLRDETN